MALISPVLPTIGQPNATEAQDVINAFVAIISAINGGLDSANLSSSAGITGTQLAETLRAAAGLNDPASSLRRRGSSIIATEEARTNTAYGLMTTPDRVSNIVLPTDGLIFVMYQATWKESVNTAANASIFVGANQLKQALNVSAAPVVQTAAQVGASAADVFRPLVSHAAGLASISSTGSATAYTGDVTTGQVVGGAGQSNGWGTGASPICAIFAAAGTYDVSVQFKSSSGSVTAKNRKLWVWSQGFD